MRRQIIDKLFDKVRGEEGLMPKLVIKLRGGGRHSNTELNTVRADQQNFLSCRHRGLELTEAPRARLVIYDQFQT